MVGDDRARPRLADGALADLATSAPQQPRQHRLPLRRFGRVLPALARPAAGLHAARISTAEDGRSTTRRRPSSITSAASCGLRRASASSTSAAAGARSDLHAAAERLRRRRAPASRCRKNQFEHVKARDRRARARGPRARRAARLSRPARGRAASTRSRASACSSTSASRASQILRQDPPDPEARRLGAEPRHHPQPAGCADSLGSGIGDFVDEYVFPGGELAHVASGDRRDGGAGARGHRCRSAARALREDALAVVRAAGSQCRCRRAEVGEEKYRVWRIYLAGSAHAFERGWLSLWQLLAGKPLPDGRLPHPLDARLHVPGRGGRLRSGPPAVRFAIPRRSAAICGCMMTLSRWRRPTSPPLKFPTAFPNQGDGTHAGRLRAGDRHGRAEARARISSRRRSRCARRAWQVPVVDLHGQRGFARAAGRPLSRSHVASDGGDGAVGRGPASGRRDGRTLPGRLDV